MKFLYIYLAVINVVAFVLMAIDKHRARRHRWRVPERVLFLPALLGGSLGALLGMLLLWHKTRHKLFVLGMPALLVLHIVLLSLLK